MNIVYLLPGIVIPSLLDINSRIPLEGHGISCISDFFSFHRWVIMYNANRDKSSKLRKSIETLRQELKQWESRQKGKTKLEISDTTTYQV